MESSESETVTLPLFREISRVNTGIAQDGPRSRWEEEGNMLSERLDIRADMTAHVYLKKNACLNRIFLGAKCIEQLVY